MPIAIQMKQFHSGGKQKRLYVALVLIKNCISFNVVVFVGGETAISSLYVHLCGRLIYGRLFERQKYKRGQKNAPAQMNGGLLDPMLYESVNTNVEVYVYIQFPAMAATRIL